MIRDVMQNAEMTGFAEFGLMLFLLGFGLVVIRVLAMKPQEAQGLSHLPLDEDEA